MPDTAKLIWRGSRAVLERGDAFLTETLWPPADAVSLRKDDVEADETSWILEAYFETPPDTENVDAALAEVVPDWPGGGVLETLEDRDWVAHALEGLGLVRIGRFLLYGVHDADKAAAQSAADASCVPIRIDANQAFGTGHHPTTEGCLAAIDRLAGTERFQNPFDLGTGSAVLATAAAKVWGAPVLASDIDETSVNIAAENVALNGVGDKVCCIVADGFSHDDIAARAPFDLIFANILAGPLVDLAAPMRAHADDGATVILAGLLMKQRADVLAAYENAGFMLVDEVAHDTWPTLVLRAV